MFQNKGENNFVNLELRLSGRINLCHILGDFKT